MSNSGTLTTLRGKKSVYIRRCNTLNPFEWLGKCSRLGGVESPRGDKTVTYRKATAVGKFEIDQSFRGAPGATTSTLMLKETVRAAIYGDLADCPFDVDVRFQNCGRVDDPLNWDQIKRLCCTEVTGLSTDDETAYSPEDEGETIVTAALSTQDFPVMIYKVNGTRVEEIGFTLYYIDHVSVLKAAKCADECGPIEDCTLIGTAIADSPGNPPAYAISTDGGRSWTVNTISAFTVATSLSDIAGVGDFIIAVADGEPGYAYSWDGGATWAKVGATVVPTFATNHPTVVEVHNFNTVLFGGLNGYIWQSTDGGVTATPVDEGVVTSSRIRRIKYVNDNVVWAVGDDNTAKRSVNGGHTWDAIAMPAGKAADDIYALLPLTELIVIVGYGSTGGLYYTLDGGDNWVQDTSIAATTLINDLSACGCGVVYAVGRAGGVGVIYRNVDYGAPARWVVVPTDAPGTKYYAVACCDANHAVATGDPTGVYGAGLITLVA